ncbi:MAG: AAA family ATPase [Bacteroidales bacterium]|nr:AAA family ATPase [Bacteroidales bacterium]
MRYIITGGPGSGKSTLIEALKSEGYTCFDEVSRKIIAHQQKIGGDLFPWGNLPGFAYACYELMLEDVHQAPAGKICFYDRGIPDIAAYLKNRDLPVNSEYFDAIKYYQPIAFLCPPWEEIFINDAQRPESFELSKRLYFHLKQTYIESGAQMIELPMDSVEERLDIVLQVVK